MIATLRSAAAAVRQLLARQRLPGLASSQRRKLSVTTERRADGCDYIRIVGG